MYKLIALDFDGTLVDHDGAIKMSDRDKIIDLQNRGYEVVIATGRTYSSVHEELDKAGLKVAVISNKGNIVRDGRTNETLVKSPINIGIITQLVDLFDGMGIEPILHIDGWGGDYDLVLLDYPGIKTSNYISFYHNRHRILMHGEWKREDVLSFVANVTKRQYDVIYRQIKKLYPKLEIHMLKPGKFDYHIMEVVGEGSNKWTGLKKYADLRNYKYDEIIAAGDDQNDLEMIRHAGKGIAMIGSPKEVLDAADSVTTKSVSESGVFDAIEEILRSES